MRWVLSRNFGLVLLPMLFGGAGSGLAGDVEVAAANDGLPTARPAIIQLYDPGLATPPEPLKPTVDPYRNRPWYRRPGYRPYFYGGYDGPRGSSPPYGNAYSGRSYSGRSRAYPTYGYADPDRYRYGYAPRAYQGYAAPAYPGWRLEWRPYWRPDTRADWRSGRRTYAGPY